VLSLQCKELKQEIGLMKQQLDMALVEIWNLKMQVPLSWIILLQ
jgi:hypothetical protein